MAFDYGLHMLRKEQARDSARGVRQMQKEAFESVPANTALRRAKREANPRLTGERASTAAKREQKALYGKYSPDTGVCPECFTVLSASGACSGACFD